MNSFYVISDKKDKHQIMPHLMSKKHKEIH